MEIKWNETHNSLMVTMQNEVALTRNLLANLHQEELSLLMHDRHSWNQVLEERATILKRLAPCRQARMEAIKKLSGERVEHLKEPALEELLPLHDENSCEVLLLRDQIMALTDRMNRQSNRNQLLFQQIERRLDLPLDSYPMQSPSYAPKKPKRISIITYPYKEPRD